MSSEENPYNLISQGRLAWSEGYESGLRDGAKRERRALRRFIRNYESYKLGIYFDTIKDWLKERAKKEKK